MRGSKLFHSLLAILGVGLITGIQLFAGEALAGKEMQDCRTIRDVIGIIGQITETADDSNEGLFRAEMAYKASACVDEILKSNQKLQSDDVEELVKSAIPLLDDREAHVPTFVASLLGSLGKDAASALPKLLKLLNNMEEENISYINKHGFIKGPTGILTVRKAIEKIKPGAVPPCPKELSDLICDDG